MAEYQTKEEIVALLKDGVCKAVFLKKKDNSKRVMICTLNEHFLPDRSEQKERRQQNVDGPDIITVFDIENEGWRRIPIDNLLEDVVRFDP